MKLKVGLKVRRYKDIGIYYDSDFGFTTILRQRTYKTENGEIQTPITPLLLARQVETDCKIPVVAAFEARYINACFANPDNDTGESNLKVIVPYRGTDEVNHKGQIKEIAAFSGVLAVDYKGETHTTSITRYVN